MIFLTVGTQFPFDRLVKAMDDLLEEGVLEEEVFGQIGDSSYKPRNFQAATSLDKTSYDEYFQNASAIISHAGMGTIAMALDLRKPLLAMPRQARYREVVNDHQAALATQFATLGHILLAEDERSLPAKVRQLRRFVPRPRQANPQAVTERITRFLEHLAMTRGGQ
jgi:beta-1,4-N-acetylglucosaminyltransferase